MKVQTKLPSRVEADNAKAVVNGYSTIDATWFRRFMEEVKFDPVMYSHDVIELFEMSNRCGCSPVGLIHFGRTTYGFKCFGRAEIHHLKEHMLADQEGGVESGEAANEDDVGDDSGSYEETEEPYNPNPTSGEAYEIDDDEGVAAATSRGKRKAATVDVDDDVDDK